MPLEQHANAHELSNEEWVWEDPEDRRSSMVKRCHWRLGPNDELMGQRYGSDGRLNADGWGVSLPSLSKKQ